VRSAEATVTFCLPLQRFEVAEVLVAGKDDEMVDVRPFHGIDREFDVHVAFTLRPCIANAQRLGDDA
jgi:hypothetical protein